MRIKPKHYLLTAFLTCLMLPMLAACGAAPEQTASGEPGEKAQNLTVAVANSSKPNSYTDTDGKLTGYEVEVLQAIDRIVPEYELTIEAVSQSAEEIGIDTGKYALIAQGFFKNAEREQKYLIPEEYTGVSLIKIYSLQDSPVNSLEELQGKKLAPVPPNGGLYNLLVQYNEAHPDTAVEIATAENVPIANRFKELIDGKYDAIIWPSASLDLQEIEKGLGAKFSASEPVQINPTYFLVSKEQSDFHTKVNDALKQLKQDGTLPQLAEKYFGENIFEYIK